MGSNVKAKTKTFRRKHRKNNLCVFGLGNDFSGHTKIMNHKRKIAKLDFIKIKTYAVCEPLFRK